VDEVMGDAELNLQDLKERFPEIANPEPGISLRPQSVIRRFEFFLFLLFLFLFCFNRKPALVLLMRGNTLSS